MGLARAEGLDHGKAPFVVKTAALKRKDDFLAGVFARFLSRPFTPSLICVLWNVIGVTWHARWNVPFDLLHRSIWLRTRKSVWKGQAQILDVTGLDLRLSHSSGPLRCDNASLSSIEGGRQDEHGLASGVRLPCTVVICGESGRSKRAAEAEKKAERQTEGSFRSGSARRNAGPT